MGITRHIPVEQAVGMVLPHDVTEIVRDKAKGRAFKKGHIIGAKDVDHLRRLGKDHIYALQLTSEEIHENEAALKLARCLAGNGVGFAPEAVEGKIALRATRDGLLKIDRERLLAFNMLGEVMCATLHDNTPVTAGEQVAATRLIPLFCHRELVELAVAIGAAGGPLIRVQPLRQARAGLVITGNEVYYGRIEDSFEQVLRDKLVALGSTVVRVALAPDDADRIAEEIRACLDAGADLIVTSGGMSVDPDDVTRQGIREAGAEDMVYGSPVLPGAMFLIGRIGRVPVIGLPACGMFHAITVFDLVLPRILAGERIGRAELAAMGHGGLCRNCRDCRYPACNFGK